MLDIYALRDMATNVAQGLKATREGNTAALEKAIAAAQKGLTGMQTAASTRQTIQQTTQAKELFPSKKGTAEETLAQAKQKTRMGDVAVEHAELTWKQVEAYTKKMEKEHGLKFPAEMWAAGLESVLKGKIKEELLDRPGVVGTAATVEQRTGEVAAEKLETELLAEPARRSQAIEEGKAGIKQAMYKGELAGEMIKQDMARLTTLAQVEWLDVKNQVARDEAKAKLVDAEAKMAAATTAAQEAQAAVDAEAAVRAAVEADGMTWDEWLVYKEMSEAGARPTQQNFNVQISSLENARARITTAATLAEAMQGAGIGDAQYLRLAERHGASQRPFTTDAQRAKAVTILEDQIFLLKKMANKMLPGTPYPEILEPIISDDDTSDLIDELRKNRAQGRQ